MARPKQKSARNRQLNIGLTDGEYQAIAARANALGIRSVEYGRRALFAGSAPSTTPETATTRHQRLLLIELRRLGNNLNQLVRKANQSGAAPGAELIGLLADIRRVLVRAMAEA